MRSKESDYGKDIQEDEERCKYKGKYWGWEERERAKKKTNKKGTEKKKRKERKKESCSTAPERGEFQKSTKRT